MQRAIEIKRLKQQNQELARARENDARAQGQNASNHERLLAERKSKQQQHLQVRLNQAGVRAIIIVQPDTHIESTASRARRSGEVKPEVSARRISMLLNIPHRKLQIVQSLNKEESTPRKVSLLGPSHLLCKLRATNYHRHVVDTYPDPNPDELFCCCLIVCSP